MAARLPINWEVYGPGLEVLSGGDVLRVQEWANEVRDRHFGDLPDEMKREETSSGVNRLMSRILWAKANLKQAKLVESPQWGFVKITNKGAKLLEREKIITVEHVDKDAEFIAYSEAVKAAKEAKSENVASTIPQSESALSPIERVDRDVEMIEEEIKAANLLEKLKKVNPYEFEKVVLRLFKEMGYGDTIATSKSRDGGIDGIINRDQLGLERIYIQAKRYGESKVTEGHIDSFAGAMSRTTISSATRKGIFVTTSEFNEKAKNSAECSNEQIILVDGAKLVDLMYKYGVGVQDIYDFKIKGIDKDFFEPIS